MIITHFILALLYIVLQMLLHIKNFCKFFLCFFFNIYRLKLYIYHRRLDLQCSTDDEEFQEVSEDENHASSILDQGERMQNTPGDGTVDMIDTSHIKVEMKLEPPQLMAG